MEFASFSESWKGFPGKCLYCFKIRQIHQYILDFLPRNGGDPAYGQQYFIDSMASTNCRLGPKENNELTKEVLRAFQSTLAQYLYVLAYHTATDDMSSLSVGKDLDFQFVDNVSLDRHVRNR